MDESRDPFMPDDLPQGGLSEELAAETVRATDDFKALLALGTYDELMTGIGALDETRLRFVTMMVVLRTRFPAMSEAERARYMGTEE